MLMPFIIISLFFLIIYFLLTNVFNIQYCTGDQFIEPRGFSGSLPLLLLLCIIHFNIDDDDDVLKDYQQTWLVRNTTRTAHE